MDASPRQPMKAVVQRAYGSADALDIREIERPVPGDDEVLIRVHAAALNGADRLLLRGEPYVMRGLAGGLRRPRTNHVLGRDVAGQVEAVGANVTGVRPGDEVYAGCPGALAEYVSVAEKFVAPKPRNLTFAQAAAIPTAGTTALEGLRDRGRVQRGQRVLINGASGGIGTFAIQIAASLGADVTAVCAARNADLVRSIGAGHVVDYTAEDFTRGQQRYDVILDLVGDHSLPALRRALAPCGTLLLSSGTGGRWLGPTRRLIAALVARPFGRRKLRTFVSTQDRGRLVALAELAESGAITPVIDRVYPFGAAVEAVRHFDRGHPAGKVVVTMTPSP